ETAWVPSGNDYELFPPGAVLFETLGWRQSPFLESKIVFKPPLLHALAQEAGIEPAVLDLLKKLGVTSEAELRARLGIADDDDASVEDADEAEHDDPESNRDQVQAERESASERSAEFGDNEEAPTGDEGVLGTRSTVGSGFGDGVG